MYNQRLDQSRSLQWCKEEGDHLIYENEWIQIIITITKFPNWNEKYKMIFKEHNKILCTIHNTRNICDHRKIQVKTWGLITQVIYPVASLRIIIVRYENEPYYDIILYQRNSTIIRQSNGLCVHESIHCHSTKDDNHHRINPTYEQLFVNEHAKEICNQYHEFIRQMMEELDLPLISQTTQDQSITSCIHDLELSGNRQFAKNILQLSLFDNINNFDIYENQINKYLEKIDYALQKTLQIIDNYTIENVTTDELQSHTTLEAENSQETTSELITTTTSTSKITTTSTFTTTSTLIPENSNDKGICHVYGDPHIIRFSQQSNIFQDQYWCKISGEHRILKNNYVEIKVFIQYRTWLIDRFNITFFKDNETILCTITDNNEQYCSSSEIKITRPSLSQMNILYVTPRLHISVVSHQYELQWYDINIRMPYALIRRSQGLCIMPSIENCEIENEQENNVNQLSISICELYVTASLQASNELNLFNDVDRYSNALIACIHDYETTGNRNFGASVVDMIIKHGINRKQFDDLQFDLQTIKSMNIIHNAIVNASTQIDILLGITTRTSSIITITQTTTTLSNLPSTTTTTLSNLPLTTTTLSNLPLTTTTLSELPSTTRSSSLSSTTTSDGSITVKSINVVLIFLLILIFY
ncbi:unnamed protein product [Rotaria sordida]|uniref:Uncharacterized protein n=1 Tax=Rotaria sordida TaxID=392033 RepID=A0A814F9Z2_9BILA|nr:unnamed protein product [Rotaria sordida]CAF3977499.1 unnamed protein product [Rotaria sordida]